MNMLKFEPFVFNPLQVNTYVLYDDTKEAVIIDPGMLFENEKSMLNDFLKNKDLKLVRMLQTHMHLDHVFGCSYIYDNYGLLPEAHKDDLFLVDTIKEYALQFGIQINETPPTPKIFLEDGDRISFGNTVLEVIAVPGHSPGGIAFFHKSSSSLFSGDVLFRDSVGRSDLPGGDHQALISGIHNKLMTLDDDVKVYSGHGPATTIGYERKNNPFI